METPDKWVIVKTPDTHKIFGSWMGGYIHGDRWRLNSGIVRMEQDRDYYYFYGHSGSIYKCHKKSYGYATSYCQGVMMALIKQSKGELTVLKGIEEYVPKCNENRKS